MKYYFFLGSKEILFEVIKEDLELLDKLAFIHLVEMKFDGEEVDATCSFDGDDDLILVKLRFPDCEKCSDAKAHCDRNIRKGNIAPDYKGALDKADPRRKMAKKIMKRAEENIN